MNTIQEKEEARIISEWFNYMSTICKKYSVTIPVIYHWGHAEKSFLKHSLQYHVDIKLPILHFIDLCNLFRQEGLVVRNTWAFGLKEIAKAMYSYGYIETKWTDDMNGMDAMVSVWEIINNIHDGKIMSLIEDNRIHSIIQYNKIDCVVLWEILTYLRKMNYIGI